jgi:hypothetical protein
MDVKKMRAGMAKSYSVVHSYKDAPTLGALPCRAVWRLELKNNMLSFVWFYRKRASPGRHGMAIYFPTDNNGESVGAHF